jgi:hypothetical protein
VAVDVESPQLPPEDSGHPLPRTKTLSHTLWHAADHTRHDKRAHTRTVSRHQAASRWLSSWPCQVVVSPSAAPG